METKGELRKKVLNIRNNMSEHDVINKSEIIINKITEFNEYKNSHTVFVYMSFKNEVKTLDLIKRMLNENKRVVIPYTDTKNVLIIPSELRSMDDDLVLSSFGYYEPIYEKIRAVEPEEFDLIIAPGLAFDRNMNRIGFGKGYYDRILSKRSAEAKIIALAYEFQVFDEVPSEVYDVKMDMVVTEESVYR